MTFRESSEVVRKGILIMHLILDSTAQQVRATLLAFTREFWQGFGKPREGPSCSRGSYRQLARDFAPGGSLSA
jgi:hypothetical protein